MPRVCGRFSLSKPAEASERFGFREWHDVRVEPRFNIAPTQEVLIVVEPTPRLATWGFTPHWLRGDGPRRPPPINARAETLDRNPMFKEALLARRCLVVADGFYEWRARSPMYIRLKGGGLFGFAGL
jgi:putative SOS response-associated peptidase YedK